MSEKNTQDKSSSVHKKLESGADHAKKALDAATAASKQVGETVREQAQTAYETGREHLTAAAKDLSAAANVKYQEIRSQAKDTAEDYRNRAKSFQGDSESYIRENPLRAVGIAIGVGFVLGVLFRR